MPRQPSFLTDEAGATGSWSRGGEPGGADMVCSLIAREYLGLFYPKSPIWPAENTIRRRGAAAGSGQFCTHARKILTKYF